MSPQNKLRLRMQRGGRGFREPPKGNESRAPSPQEPTPPVSNRLPGPPAQPPLLWSCPRMIPVPQPPPLPPLSPHRRLDPGSRGSPSRHHSQPIGSKALGVLLPGPLSSAATPPAQAPTSQAPPPAPTTTRSVPASVFRGLLPGIPLPAARTFWQTGPLLPNQQRPISLNRSFLSLL